MYYYPLYPSISLLTPYDFINITNIHYFPIIIFIPPDIIYFHWRLNLFIRHTYSHIISFYINNQV